MRKGAWLGLGGAAIAALALGAIFILGHDSTNTIGETIDDPRSGLSIQIPVGWDAKRADGEYRGFKLWTGAEDVYDPECTGVDDSVRIDVWERRLPALETTSRPASFSAADGSTDTWETLAEIQCDEIWQTIQFSDQERTFIALIRSGRHGSQSQREKARQILDTLRVRDPGSPTGT